MKPAEIDIRSLSPGVRAALEWVVALGDIEPAVRSLELAAVLAQLQADDEVLLTGLLAPLLQANQVDEPRALEIFGAAALKLARELGRVGESGIPAGWNPGTHLKPEQAEGLRKLLLALASDVRLVLIRLATQLVRMRSLKSATPDETLPPWQWRRRCWLRFWTQRIRGPPCWRR